MSRMFSCPECDVLLEVGNQGPESVVDVPCWRCDTCIRYDQYRRKVMETV